MRKKKEVDLKAQAMAAAEGLKRAIINEGNEGESIEKFNSRPIDFSDAESEFDKMIIMSLERMKRREKKIIEYAGIALGDAKALMEEVNNLLGQGFVPHGGMGMIQDQSNYRWMFFQSMVKYE